MLDYCQITKSHSYTAQPVLSDHPWETEEWSFNRGGRLIEGIPPLITKSPIFVFWEVVFCFFVAPKYENLFLHSEKLAAMYMYLIHKLCFLYFSSQAFQDATPATH